MLANLSKGFFITLEGIEGSGKSTQQQLLAKALTELGFAVLTTREPGGTALGERIRELLLDPSWLIAPAAELLLYAADRAQHLAMMVEPALSEGKVVICDRHADSLLAYQAFGRDLPRQLVETANQLATGGRAPDLTLLLDLDPVLGLARVETRGNRDRMENETLAFHRRVRAGFLAIAAEAPRRVKIIAANRSIAAIQQDLALEVLRHLGPGTPGPK
ncbi:MAG: dTMP kinase [Cyanobacteria bacterium NC_groundwater_1444_Ag_S-0.65um_54_12]|nr:dTMP kinase [Cyanobacteria bacterium NC_groundwater_1444_Ag_S-0.65um_54_12]